MFGQRVEHVIAENQKRSRRCRARNARSSIGMHEINKLGTFRKQSAASFGAFLQLIRAEPASRSQNLKYRCRNHVRTALSLQHVRAIHASQHLTAFPSRTTQSIRRKTPKRVGANAANVKPSFCSSVEISLAAARTAIAAAPVCRNAVGYRPLPLASRVTRAGGPRSGAEWFVATGSSWYPLQLRSIRPGAYEGDTVAAPMCP